MRIAGMGVDGNVRAFFGHEASGGKFTKNPLLDFRFTLRAIFANASGGKLEGFGDDTVDLLGGVEVRFELFWRPDSFVFLNEVGGADNFYASGANEFDRARIHHGDVRNLVLRR